MVKTTNLAYVIGVAIGDGNLSNPNGRAVRLRITCDKKYPNLVYRILNSIQKIHPDNKVSLIYRRDNCIDVSCYSNKWERILGWSANSGPKHTQYIHSPDWIKKHKRYIKHYLKGLFETDGSIYFDRKYKMVNFTTIIPNLADEVKQMIDILGFSSNLQIYNPNQNIKPKYTIRISKNVEKFIECINLEKN